MKAKRTSLHAILFATFALGLCIGSHAYAQGTAYVELSGSTANDDFVISNGIETLFGVNGDGRTHIGNTLVQGNLLYLHNDNMQTLLGASGNVQNCIFVSNTNPDQWGGNGIFAKSTNGFAIRAESNHQSAVYGKCTSTSFIGGYGVQGLSESSEGRGVFGWATATSGGTMGVGGQADSPQGRALWGSALSPSGITYGLYARVKSPDGYGAYGTNSATSGDAIGVYGATASALGIAIKGVNSSTNSAGHLAGVFNGYKYGVFGEVSQTSGVVFGVLGTTQSPDGRGLYGSSEASSGGYGVYGDADNATGTGVHGVNTPTGARGSLGGGNNGVWATAGSGGKAGYFEGDVMITGEMRIDGHIWQDWGGYLRLERDPGTNNAYFAAPSDRRLKRDIEQLPKALESLQQLRGVTYQWNEQGLAYHTKDIEATWKSTTGSAEDDMSLWEEKRVEIISEIDGPKIGFIAQEVEEVFPQWVVEEDGIKKIDMKELDAVLVEAVKELHDIVQKQNDRIMKLERELATFRTAPKDSKFSQTVQTK